MRMRLISWNVHGLPAPFSSMRPARLARIAMRAAADGADVVALQEAWPGSVPILAAAAPGYTVAFAKNRPGHAAGGLAVLLRRDGDWTLAEEPPAFRPFSRSAPVWRIWEADGVGGKGAMFVRLAHRASGARLLLVNTHLQSRYRRDSYAKIRLAQLVELAIWLRDFEDGHARVVAGDFNTPPEEEALFTAVRALGRDMTVAERRDGIVTHYPVHADPGWIDHVLATPADGCGVQAKVSLILNDDVDDPFSDHHGLVVDLTFEPAAGAGSRPRL